MATNAKRQIDVIVKARDEASSTFAKIAQNAKALNLEARQSGEAGFEKIIKGGGALALASFGAEIVTKAAHAARESMEELSSGTATAGESFGHFLEKASDAVPVVGTFRKMFTELGAAGSDAAAAVAEYFGASESVVDSLLSDETFKKRSEAFNKFADDVREAMEKAHNRGTEAALKGFDLERHKAEETYRAEAKEIEELRKERAKLPLVQQPKLNSEINSLEIQRAHQLAATLIRIDHEQYDAQFKAAMEYRDKIAALRAAPDIATFHEAGLDLQAQLLEARTKLQADIHALMIEAHDKVRENPADALSIDEQARKKISLTKRNEALEEERFHREQKRKEESEEYEHQSKLIDITTKAASLKLEMSGKDFEAQQVQLRAGYDRQIAEIDRATKEKVDRLKLLETPESQEEIARLTLQARGEKQALDNLYQGEAGKLVQQNALKPSDFRAPTLEEGSRLTGAGRARNENT